MGLASLYGRAELENGPAAGSLQQPKVWGEVIEGLKLGLAFDKEVFQDGQPITGVVTISNVSNVTRRYSVTAPDILKSRITVSGPDGKFLQSKYAITATSSFRDRLKSTIQRAYNLGLAPGEQRDHPIRLDKVFDFPVAGRYYVTVSRDVPKLDGTGENTVTSETAVIGIEKPVAGIERGQGEQHTNVSPFRAGANATNAQAADQAPKGSGPAQRTDSINSAESNELNIPSPADQPASPSEQVVTNNPLPAKYGRYGLAAALCVVIGSALFLLVRRRKTIPTKS